MLTGEKQKEKNTKEVHVLHCGLEGKWMTSYTFNKVHSATEEANCSLLRNVGIVGNITQEASND